MERTVALVDDDDISMQTLRSVVNLHCPHCHVLWSTRTGASALARVRDIEQCPDILLVDLSLGDMRGVTLCRKIRTMSASPSILVLSTVPLGECSQDVAEAGAQGIIFKKAEYYELTAAVAAILGEEGCYRNADTDVLFLNACESYVKIQNEGVLGVEALSRSECEVTSWCARGYTSSEIAVILGKSKATVDTLLQRAMKKTDARNRVELAIRWNREYGKRW